jgi:hypothetical protein
MNLICFPHYTCGGLLCDILTERFSSIGPHGGVNSFHHTLGKIGDADTVFVDYDSSLFFSTLEKIPATDSDWIGTHCWPGKLDLSLFDQVIVVTTATFKSKLYRWTRAYYLYYFNSLPWTEVTGQIRVDKERETAKNYLVPFEPIFQSNVTNIEFSEVVESSVQFQNMVSPKKIKPHMDRWRQVNKFLYDPEIWNSVPFQRYYEADLETQLQQYYEYQ